MISQETIKILKEICAYGNLRVDTVLNNVNNTLEKDRYISPERSLIHSLQLEKIANMIEECKKLAVRDYLLKDLEGNGLLSQLRAFGLRGSK